MVLCRQYKIIMKGESVCVNYYQCTKCGAIMPFERKLELEDDIYADLYCDKCGRSRVLYLGDNKDDFYIYADNFLDERYFIYGDNNTKL